MEEKNEVYSGEIWSVHRGKDDSPTKRERSSRKTIIICSIVLLGVTAALTTWVFVVRPTFYPKLKIMSRADDSDSETRHHIGRRSEDFDAEVRSNIGTEETNARKLHGKSKLEKLFVDVEEKEDFPHKSSRLPKALLPVDYYIRLDVDLTKDKYKGEVSIDLKCVEDTNYVIFHGRMLKIKHVDVGLVTDPDKLKIRRILFFQKYEMYLVEVNQKFRKGNEYTVSIEFQTKFNEYLAGLYKSQYRAENGQFRYDLNIYKLF